MTVIASLDNENYIALPFEESVFILKSATSKNRTHKIMGYPINGTSGWCLLSDKDKKAVTLEFLNMLASASRGNKVYVIKEDMVTNEIIDMLKG